jgi:ribonuclease VapC
MVIDSSALLAILQNEPERRRFNEAIEAAATRLLSVASFVEVSIVMEVRHGAEGVRDFDLLIERAGIQLCDVTADHARRARGAYARYGKGRHRANLNYGNCFAYALADAHSEPLLFKGDDFAYTDVVSAL